MGDKCILAQFAMEITLYPNKTNPNATNSLMRNLTLRFGRKNETGYGVRQAWGTFQLAYFDYNETKGNETNTYKIVSSVKIDTHDVPKLMFEVPFHYSYQRRRWQVAV